MTRHRQKKQPGTFILLFFLVGCGSTTVTEDNPEALFKEAQEDIEDDRYLLALERLRKVKSKFPYSKYSAISQLRIADVYFLQESFVEAASSYELFRDLHPKHKQVPYAMFRIGEAYFQSIPSNIARDQSNAKNALSSFRKFVRRYPKDKRTPEARKRIGETRKVMAEKELYIADFYFIRDFYKSARGRYKKVIKEYPKTEASKYAEERLKVAEAEIREEEGDKPKTKKTKK